jgi:hypothetical protein
LPSSKPSPEPSAKQQLAHFISQFSPEIASLARAALSIMRDRLPGAFELVYDNAYALVVGFGPTPKPSEAIFSVVIYPKKVSLCFLYGARLYDAEHLLQGTRNQVRHIRLESGATLKKRGIRTLMNVAIDDAVAPFDGTQRGQTIIRAISKNRRARRVPL